MSDWDGPPRAVYGAPPAPGNNRDLFKEQAERLKRLEQLDQQIPMRIPCPDCGQLHIDEGEFATKPHHTHACQHCGHVWRPAVVNTVGVRFLPGFKNELKEGT